MAECIEGSHGAIFLVTRETSGPLVLPLAKSNVRGEQLDATWLVFLQTARIKAKGKGKIVR